MAFLDHDPETFAAAAAAGFVAVHGELVQQVPGGVVRATRSAADEVAVVIGGGSGHYPAFGGLVGPGLAHGAVLGNIFASPSAHQVTDVARCAEQGRGVLLSYGNYAGDVLQFEAGAERLRQSGIPVRSVAVTDDISSAPPAEASKRRGIAGDLVVFKIAGAAATAGYDLDGVARVAEAANAATRSLGVAFSGCTLPGADEPLFRVPAGRMSVGLGIHGEPGLEDVDIPTPHGLAELLVGRLLAEVPGGHDPHGRRVIVILNGLGSFKYDELYVVFDEVRRALAARGIVLADARVGEFCTSFEMSGLSLTLCWPDEELEGLWRAPARSAAYVQGSPADDALRTVDLADRAVGDPAGAGATTPAASEQSRAYVPRILTALETLSRTVDEHADDLGRIDAVAGDGDHGLGMQRGAHAAVAAARAAGAAGAGAGTTLRRAAEGWSDDAGGTSGALWGLILGAVAEAIGDTDSPTADAVRRGVRDACARVIEHGGAHVGDKTMVDALAPFAAALDDEPSTPLTTDWPRAAEAARRAADGTAAMLPKLGRARTHGAKAVGTPDPGAVSFALIVTALGEQALR
ncbi:dihydroxyacetone kinase family protein [Raineyella sp. LH-20]|uniref:dihydroxyacetone kinase family protein n=1 Tax=Raineyella sp. LH-20 TaxID=3081204 RepID=UPI002952DF56|nr:dihydroxyacetone kinase family protein [Raineyella sp. LH-20]WOP19092.1 dihydroxyacetone kinase family protein [Raineyella sp. LH-20]